MFTAPSAWMCRPLWKLLLNWLSVTVTDAGESNSAAVVTRCAPVMPATVLSWILTLLTLMLFVVSTYSADESFGFVISPAPLITILLIETGAVQFMIEMLVSKYE